MWLIHLFKKETPEDIRQRDLIEAKTLLLDYEKNVEWFAAMATAMRNRIDRLEQPPVVRGLRQPIGGSEHGNKIRQT